MHAFARLLLTPAQWLPLVVLGLALVGARRLRLGLFLAGLLGGGVAAVGMVGVLLGETLLYVISVPQAHHMAAFLGPWPVLVPLLGALACAAPIGLRWRGLGAWTHVDAILAGVTLVLLGTAWNHPLPPPPGR